MGFLSFCFTRSPFNFIVDITPGNVFDDQITNEERDVHGG